MPKKYAKTFKEPEYKIDLRCKCGYLTTVKKVWKSYPDPQRIKCGCCGTIYLLAKFQSLAPKDKE